MLVLMGGTAEGRKELIAVQDGYRESEPCWSEPLLGLKQRGLTIEPKWAIAEGALGFWVAVRKIFPAVEAQHCWVHKTATLLKDLPKSVQPKAKADIHDIWQAETRANAETTFDHFLEKYTSKSFTYSLEKPSKTEPSRTPPQTFSEHTK